MNWLLIILGIVILYLSDYFTGLIRDIQHQLDILELKRETEKLEAMMDEEKEKDRESRRFYSTKDMMANMNEGKGCVDRFFDRHDGLHYLRAILWYRLLDHPQDLHLWIKTKYQRAKRGWADSDAWGFYDYLINVIIGGLGYIKKYKHGVPSAFVVKNDDDNLTKSSAKWDKALDCMIKTFNTARKIEDKYWMYQNSEKYDVKLSNKFKKINKKMREKSPKLWGENALRVMTKKECKEYEKGWRLFQEHFFSLWD